METDFLTIVKQVLNSMELRSVLMMSGALLLEAFLTIGAFIASLFFIFFLVRVFVIGPHVIMQISADGTKGWWNRIRSAAHYLYNAEKLKRLYIRNGKISERPVYLVRNIEDHISDNQKNS